MNSILLPQFHKPPIGTQLDRFGSSLARGLFYFAPLWEGAGSTVADVAGGNTAAITGATWTPGTYSVGLNLNAASRYASVALPPALQFAAWPATIAVGFRFLTAAGTTPLIFGITYSNFSGDNPYEVIAVGQYSAGTLGGFYNTGGTFGQVGPAFTFAVGSDYVVSYSIGAANQDLYLNGADVHSTTTALSAPHWGATPLVTIGNANSTTEAGVLVYWAGAWNRYLNANEHAELARNPWQVFRPIWSAAVISEGLPTPTAFRGLTVSSPRRMKPGRAGFTRSSIGATPPQTAFHGLMASSPRRMKPGRAGLRGITLGTTVFVPPLTSSVPVHRPVSDRTGSRRTIWQE